MRKMIESLIDHAEVAEEEVELLSFQDVFDSITSNLAGAPLDDLVKFHNLIHTKQIEYLEDGMFQYVEDAQKNWERRMKSK